MTYLRSCLPVLVVLFYSAQGLLSQNLVPNGSFEEFEACPEGLDDMNSCAQWSVSRGTPDFYHMCSQGSGVSVPASANGYQYPLFGEGYAGFIQFRTPNPDAREHLFCELLEPLNVGAMYFFSMYVNRGSSLWLVKASNGQGAMLTTQDHFTTEEPSSIMSPTFVNWEIVSDSTYWKQLKWSFVADSSYSHLVVGGFLSDAQLDTVGVPDPIPYGEAYYFVDEVRLSTDSSYAWQSLGTEEQAKEEIGIYPNPFSDMVYVKGLQENQKVRVLDSVGQVVSSYSRGDSYFEGSFLSSGIYFFEIVGTKERKVIRVVKE